MANTTGDDAPQVPAQDGLLAANVLRAQPCINPDGSLDGLMTLILLASFSDGTRMMCVRIYTAHHTSALVRAQKLNEAMRQLAAGTMPKSACATLG